MKRRDFIKIVGSSALLMPMASPALLTNSRILDFDKWNSFRLTYEVNLPAAGKRARLWLPIPNSFDSGYQYTQGSNWSGTASRAQFTTLGQRKFPVFFAEWNGEGKRQVSVQSIIKTSHRAVNLDYYRHSNNTSIPSNIRPFLNATRTIPVSGIVKDVAYSIIYDESSTTVDKAKAIYDWLVDHFQYDEMTRGSGTGDIKYMLENSKLSGKCVDIHSLFVGLARSIGIPARVQYGIRMMESQLHDSIGKRADISHAQHSRAEFYLNDVGWVPINPADVCKVAKFENREPDDLEMAYLRERLFGAWEMNWITFNHGQDVQLTNSKAGKLPFFLFPHAEIDGRSQDSLDSENFSYRIVSAELIGTGAKF